MWDKTKRLIALCADKAVDYFDGGKVFAGMAFCGLLYFLVSSVLLLPLYFLVNYFVGTSSVVSALLSIAMIVAYSSIMGIWQGILHKIFNG